MPCVTSDVATPKVFSCDKYAIDVEPIPPRIRNNKEVHLDYLKHLKESVETLRTIVEEAKPTDRIIPLGGQCPLVRPTASTSGLMVDTAPAIQIVLWYLDSCCSKHITGDISWLRNFLKKFIGTVRFKNDYFGAIIGYGDYIIDDSVISRVYNAEGLGHNQFSVGQFCDSDLKVAFRKHICFIRDLDGVDLIQGTRSTNLYTICNTPKMGHSRIMYPGALLHNTIAQVMRE
nr:integrase, catalytic region, zinc finger, CCHC-type, peptidase aspartic, catalytic [Tanacetum cinerariifolium]